MNCEILFNILNFYITFIFEILNIYNVCLVNKIYLIYLVLEYVNSF